MATEFFGGDASESALNTLADMLDGVGQNAVQLNSVVQQLIASICGGITDNDTCLNKIIAVIRGQLTRAVNANANLLSPVSQTLQTAVTNQAGELAAQTQMVAAQAASVQ